jgi:hypothetical protein
MIELRNDRLIFSFPEVHPEARLAIEFQRTLRIPDDEGTYPLPPGLGRFPVRHVDDFGTRVPGPWIEHGGVMLPMHQSEALWLNFDAGYVEDRETHYPFAIKVAAGKIDAVTGKGWSESLHGKPQDYLVAPEQPWLDGFCVEKGYIRQFVAMPLGEGYTAEEQLTGEAEHGGLQILAYPMKRHVFEKRFPKVSERRRVYAGADLLMAPCAPPPDMGLAPGGRMRQEIYADPFSIKVWDQTSSSRCFVHLANSVAWSAITGTLPPTVPPTAEEYNNAGLPWFEYYAEDAKAVKGAKKLAGLDSVATLGEKKGETPLPDNNSVTPEEIVELRKGMTPGQVREGRF